MVGWMGGSGSLVPTENPRRLKSMVDSLEGKDS